MKNFKLDLLNYKIDRCLRLKKLFTKKKEMLYFL